MNHTELFQLLIKYHITQNLPNCALHMARAGINEGRIIHPQKGESVGEGAENELYKGIMIISDGETLESTLMENGVITAEEIGDVCPIRDEHDLFAYMNSQTENDGVFLYDRPHNRMTRVFNAYPPNQNNAAYIGPFLPYNFVFSGNKQPVQNGEVGTKTKLAVKVTQAFPHLHAYQIKRTAYGALGMGKVTHFTSQGLYEEFFLRYDQQAAAICGVYIRYERKGEELVPCEYKETPVLSLKRPEKRQKQRPSELDRILDMAA